MISMKRQLAAITLALASTAAFASPLHLDASAFTFDTDSYYSPEMILSDSNGVTRIAMNAIGSDLNEWRTGEGESGNYSSGTYRIGVRSGYRVSGYGLSGEFVGELAPGANPWDPQLPGNGSATNRGMVTMSATAAGGSHYYDSYTFNQAPLNGVNGFTMTSATMSLVTDFNIDVAGLVNVQAVDSVYYGGEYYVEYRTPSFASMGLNNLVLTVYTAPIASPVPEPETYAMMLAGLAAIGFASRRRKQVLGENQS